MGKLSKFFEGGNACLMPLQGVVTAANFELLNEAQHTNDSERIDRGFVAIFSNFSLFHGLYFPLVIGSSTKQLDFQPG